MAVPTREVYGTDWYIAEDADAADTLSTFELAGGTYAIEAIAATWGGGNVMLQKLGGDRTTYYDILATAITGNGLQVGDLPAGTYKLVITTTNAVYASVSRIARRV